MFVFFSWFTAAAISHFLLIQHVGLQAPLLHHSQKVRLANCPWRKSDGSPKEWSQRGVFHWNQRCDQLSLVPEAEGGSQSCRNTCLSRSRVYVCALSRSSLTGIHAGSSSGRLDNVLLFELRINIEAVCVKTCSVWQGNNSSVLPQFQIFSVL